MAVLLIDLEGIFNQILLDSYLIIGVCLLFTLEVLKKLYRLLFSMISCGCSSCLHVSYHPTRKIPNILIRRSVYQKKNLNKPNSILIEFSLKMSSYVTLHLKIYEKMENALNDATEYEILSVLPSSFGKSHFENVSYSHICNNQKYSQINI